MEAIFKNQKASLILEALENVAKMDGDSRPLPQPFIGRTGEELERYAIFYDIDARHYNYVKGTDLNFLTEAFTQRWTYIFNTDPLIRRLILEYDGDYMRLENDLQEESSGLFLTNLHLNQASELLFCKNFVQSCSFTKKKECVCGNSQF